MLSQRLTQLPRHLLSTTARTPLTLRTLTTSSQLLSNEDTQHTDWKGRAPQENANARSSNLDLHSDASQSGKKSRAEGGSKNESATSGADARDDNKRAQKEFPESPMVIGMNDERGPKGH